MEYDLPVKTICLGKIQRQRRVIDKNTRTPDGVDRNETGCYEIKPACKPYYNKMRHRERVCFKKQEADISRSKLDLEVAIGDNLPSYPDKFGTGTFLDKYNARDQMFDT